MLNVKRGVSVSVWTSWAHKCDDVVGNTKTMTNNWLHKWTLINERCLSSLASTRFIIIYLFIMANWSGAFVMHLWFYVNTYTIHIHSLPFSLSLPRAPFIKFPHKVAPCVMYCDTKVFQFHAASKSIRIQIHSSVMSFFHTFFCFCYSKNTFTTCCLWLLCDVIQFMRWPNDVVRLFNCGSGCEKKKF